MSGTPTIETAKEAARRLAATAIRDGYIPDGLHVYSDPDGLPVFCRIRAKHPLTGEKWVRPMHCNGGRYMLGEPSSILGKRLLYRLHELAKSDPLHPVWFVEGEKCADALAKLGLIATTTGGATSDESADFAPLRARSVILWPDNDVPGRDHMCRVGKRLRALGCSVETVEIDPLGLPEKGDVVDYLLAHEDATAAGLMALARTPGSPKANGTPIGPIDLIRGDAIKVEPVRWLWEGWLARGKLHILAGAPGTGKTTIALAMAATITVAGRWPDSSRAGSGSVLIWSGEDDPADTLAPRLIAMGANMSRVHFIGGVCDGANHRSFDPARDMRDLSVQATAIGDVRLMILDPIVNAVGGDGHKSNDVRRDLAPIVDLASALDCAALGISHFTKGTAGKDPVERVTGSLAFGALARLVLAAAKIKEDDGNERRLLARAKSNIGPDGGGFSYVLEQCQVPGHPEISASRVMWGGAVDGTARELLADADAQGDPDGESPADVEDFVRGCLDRGPATAKSLMADANGAGYSWDQVKRAARRLDVEKRKEGMRGGWVWALRRGQNHEGRTEGGEEGTHKSLQPSHSSAPASVSMTDAEPPFLRDLEVF